MPPNSDVLAQAAAIRSQLQADVQSALATFTHHLTLVIQTNPETTDARELLDRPDVHEALDIALTDAREKARKAVEAAAQLAGDQSSQYQLAIGKDVTDLYDNAAAQVRGVVIRAFNSVPQPPPYTPGVDPLGSNPVFEAGQARARAVGAALTRQAADMALRNGLSVSVAGSRSHAESVVEEALSRYEAGEDIWLEWRSRKIPGVTCPWCWALDGHRVRPGHEFPHPVQVGRRKPPRLYQGVLHGPPLHPQCVASGTRVVVPGDVSDGLSPDLAARRPGFTGDGREPAAAAVTESERDYGRRNVRAVTHRDYVGEIVVIKTAAGHELSVTPNHPVATRGGWVAASEIKTGDYVLSSGAAHWGMDVPAGRSGPDVDEIPPAIQEVAETFSVVFGAVPTAPEDFHGDGGGSDVSIIRADSSLVADADSLCREHRRQFDFVYGGVAGVHALPFDTLSLPLEEVGGLSSASDGSVGCGGLRSSLLRSAASGRDALLLARGSRRDASPKQSVLDGPAVDSEGFCEHLYASSSGIQTDEVVEVYRYSAHTEVYNLSTSKGWYFAEGIVTKNCMCWLVIVTSGGEPVLEAPEPPPEQFVSSRDIGAMDDAKYAGLLAFLKAALHELGLMLKRLIGHG